MITSIVLLPYLSLAIPQYVSIIVLERPYCDGKTMATEELRGFLSIEGRKITRDARAAAKFKTSEEARLFGQYAATLWEEQGWKAYSFYTRIPRDLDKPHGYRTLRFERDAPGLMANPLDKVSDHRRHHANRGKQHRNQILHRRAILCRWDEVATLFQCRRTIKSPDETMGRRKTNRPGCA